MGEIRGVGESRCVSRSEPLSASLFSSIHCRYYNGVRKWVLGDGVRR